MVAEHGESAVVGNQLLRLLPGVGRAARNTNGVARAAQRRPIRVFRRESRLFLGLQRLVAHQKRLRTPKVYLEFVCELFFVNLFLFDLKMFYLIFWIYLGLSHFGRKGGIP